MALSGEIYKAIIDKADRQEKQFAVLVDPDKQNASELLKLIDVCSDQDVDYFFVGGSLMTSGDLDKTCRFIKENSSIPVIIFPGSPSQISKYADGILFLSLISGRNPELLIGNQVIAAPYLKKMDIEILSTGYILIDCGNQTTAIYMSGTNPIPYKKNDIAACTALAGEYLGMRLIYMDGGSGADQHISCEMVEAVKKDLKTPLIVGGGIRDAETAKSIYESGADVIVIGNAIEKNPDLIQEISTLKKSINTAKNRSYKI